MNYKAYALMLLKINFLQGGVCQENLCFKAIQAGDVATVYSWQSISISLHLSTH